MRSLIILIIAALLASCTTDYMCSSYGQSNKITKHGQKSQAKYARHNRHRSLF